jgi:3-deoxy-D-manno-octulosonic-acid transferase
MAKKFNWKDYLPLAITDALTMKLAHKRGMSVKTYLSSGLLSIDVVNYKRRGYFVAYMDAQEITVILQCYEELIERLKAIGADDVNSYYKLKVLEHYKRTAQSRLKRHALRQKRETETETPVDTTGNNDSNTAVE